MINFLAYILSCPFTLFLICINRSLAVSIQVPEDEELFSDQNHIFAIWHQNTFTPFYVYRHRNVAMFVTNNLRGKILGYAARHLGYDPIPLQDQSKSALMMCKKVKQGQNSIMAVDGPHGPVKQIKNGTHYLTEKTGAPTIAIDVSYSRFITLRMRWDHYRIPLPFSHVTITFSKSYHIDDNWEEIVNELG